MILTIFIFIEHIILVPVRTALLANEEYRYIYIVRAFNILFVPLILIVMREHSLTLVALVYGLFTCISSCTLLAISLKHISIKFPWTFLAQIIISATIAGIVVNVLSSNALTITNMFYTLFLFVVSYIIVFKLLGGLVEQDKNLLRNMHFPFKKIILKIM